MFQNALKKTDRWTKRRTKAWMQESSTCLSIYFDRPSHAGICNRNFVSVAPLQLGEEVFWIHSARLEEALVTASLHLDARGLKARATSKTTVEGSRWKFFEAPFPLA